MMSFYKAERSRVLWLQQQSSVEESIEAQEEMEVETVNDENALSTDTNSFDVRPRSGYKRVAPSGSPFMMSNIKKAKT
ncbi:unnamed protein product [Nippostrongylus brasiliensis]|uniref:Ovule protein n=1 Tax=Nippostrongylus brasiliensis TaxID=27835 RepID=A0A0N4Y4B8_NIPBR|nr:unnamed protein product [Nippostrongylus brasiliensis]